jgi:hypothetical protein
VVRRFLSLALLFVAVMVTGIVHADEAPANDEPTFDELVREGDIARFSGRNSDAVHAYMRALKIRYEPRIAGRLGLVALAGGAPAQAAHYLMRAIVDAHTIPAGERQQIKDAFDRARPLVSRINIKISHVGAELTIDGKPENMAKSATYFYVFRLPGHHEFRATLEGFEDAVVTIDTKKGDTIDVSLVLTPLPLNENATEPAPVVTCEPKAEPAPCEACKPSSSEPTPPASNTANDKMNDDERVRWMPGIGATVLYGAVSPYPAAGFTISSYWKFNSVMSFGFDFRTAVSPREIEGSAIRGTAFIFLPNLCATREWFTGCLAIHTGLMWHSSLAPRTSIVRRSVGGGVNFGAKFARYKSIDFQAKLFGELLLDEYPIRFGGGLADVLWTGPQYITGISIVAVWNGR